MKKVNVIIVFNPKETEVLMCHRVKNPYKGLYNFVGGKLLANEEDYKGAYRELYEETAIKSSDIDLELLYKTYYPVGNLELQVYFGTLKNEVELVEEVNPLLWMSLEEDFTDLNKFAGDGNIQHMMLVIEEIKSLRRY